MCHVTEINRLEDLEGIREVWKTLLAKTPRASFFQSLDWLQIYWQHYGAEQKLRVLLVTVGGQPVGILPWCVRRESTKLGGVRLLTYPLHDWGSFYSPLGAAPTLTLLEGLRHLQTTRRDWDLLDLRWVRQEDGEQEAVANAMRQVGFSPQVETTAQSTWIDLSEGWDSYWKSRKSEWRTNVRRSQKKVAELGEVEYLRYRPEGPAQADADPRWDLYDTCERLAQESWQGSATDGTTLSHGSIREFLRSAHQRAVECGAADVNLLYVGGRTVAFAYAYHFRGHLYGLRMGFDAGFSRAGLGSVLQARLIEDFLCAGGNQTYDLGPDYSPAKKYWRTSLEGIGRCTYYARPSWKAQVLKAKRVWRGWWQGQVANEESAASAS